MDKKDPDEMATGPEAGLTETCRGGRPPKTAPHSRTRLVHAANGREQSHAQWDAEPDLLEIQFEFALIEALFELEVVARQGMHDTDHAPGLLLDVFEIVDSRHDGGISRLPLRAAVRR